jgi:queuine tRNA-ribosyltransferase
MRASRTIMTPHGALTTPFFMPDATRASIRGLEREVLYQTGTNAMVVNTYHLMLDPGVDLIVRAGGVHEFMGWTMPLVSDSGGYQVYSLIHKKSDLGTVTEEGVRFRSVRDGSWHDLTPERAVDLQVGLGTDVMVVLDDPRPVAVSKAEMTASVERTIRWARRCRNAYAHHAQEQSWTARNRPRLCAVIQGGAHIDLRQQCADALNDIAREVDNGFGDQVWDVMGFGGRHVDEHGVIMRDVLAATAQKIPQQSLAFGLGIGTPQDIVQAISCGWEMFDCVIPTREGRHGRVFLWEDDGKNILRDAMRCGTVPARGFYKTYDIARQAFREDSTPIDERCTCGCAAYTRQYVRHLFSVRDSLGAHIIARHNLRFYAEMMQILQEALKKTDLSE